MTSIPETPSGGTINFATRNEKREEFWTAIPNAIMLDTAISDGAYRLYSLMLMYSYSADGCSLSQEAMAKDTGKNARTVRRLIDELEALGVVQKRQNGLKENNTYYVEPAKAIADKNVRSHLKTAIKANTHRTKMSVQTGQKCPVSADKNVRHLKTFRSEEEKKEEKKPGVSTSSFPEPDRKEFQDKEASGWNLSLPPYIEAAVQSYGHRRVLDELRRRQEMAKRKGANVPTLDRMARVIREIEQEARQAAAA